jgi:hypothetical protein
MFWSMGFRLAKINLQLDILPFAVRPAIRDQVRQTLQDDSLEISDSPFLNPLSAVYKECKKIKICVDARKVNQYTVPVRELAPHS